jgi:hypothetical protein
MSKKFKNKQKSSNFFHQSSALNMKYLFLLLIVALLVCNVNCQQKTCETTTSTLGFCGKAQEEDDEEMDEK